MERVAVVSGGTRGIGKGISTVLAGSGYKVVSLYKSNKESALRVEEELKKLSPESCVYSCNVSDQEEVDRLFAFVEEKYGRVDVLVNNAGGGPLTYWTEVTNETIDRDVALNIKSTYFMSKAAAKLMIRNHYGRIINASSIAAVFPDVYLSVYAAVKSGVRALTKALAAELGPFGITVNAYAPGVVDTDVTHQMLVERGDYQKRNIAVGRIGTPEDIAYLVRFLASEEAEYITGQTIGVDGGMFAIQSQFRANEAAEEFLSNF